MMSLSAFPQRLFNWYDNLRKLALGRPAWSAERELAYYRVTEEIVAEHRQRQKAHVRESYFSGLRTMRDMGLLDADIVRGASILDIGAGEGFLAAALAHAGAAEVYALDAVPKQLFAAAEAHASSNSLHFLIGSGSDTPFESESFDLVVAHLVLHHIEPLEPLLREVMRVLRPGGRFIAVEPTPLVGLLAHGKTSDNEAPISPKRVRSDLVRVGFGDISHRYHWSRLDTSRLGPLSPGYVVTARKEGACPEREPVRLRRELLDTALPGLKIDAECPFGDLVGPQIDQIRAAIADSST